MKGFRHFDEDFVTMKNKKRKRKILKTLKTMRYNLFSELNFVIKVSFYNKRNV